MSRELTIKAKWVFDNGDTHNLVYKNISIAEIKYYKYWGGTFYVTLGQNCSSSLILNPSAEFDTLKQAKSWAETRLGAIETRKRQLTRKVAAKAFKEMTND